jgi:hypothetical protein
MRSNVMNNIKLKSFVGLAILLAVTFSPLPAARAGNGAPMPELPPTCERLQVPEGNKLSFHVYARGVQVYKWNGASWAFVGPIATLYADAGYHSQVGIHYGGPTWESNSGSIVKGAVVERCTPDPNAIQWLRLAASSNSGPGIFGSVTFIQRLNTAGGLAPSDPGSYVGQVVEVPYTTEYYFYRAE